MRIADRVLLTLYALVIALASIGAVLYGLNYAGLQGAVTALAGSPVLIVAGAVMFLASLRLLLVRRKAPQEDGFVRLTDQGMIRISFETLESMAARATLEHRGVVNLTTRVGPYADGVRVALRFLVSPGVDVTALGAELQTAVKERIEQLTGIPVVAVQVHVRDLADSTLRSGRARVQ